MILRQTLQSHDKMLAKALVDFVNHSQSDNVGEIIEVKRKSAVRHENEPRKSFGKEDPKFGSYQENTFSLQVPVEQQMTNEPQIIKTIDDVQNSLKGRATRKERQSDSTLKTICQNLLTEYDEEAVHKIEQQ
jgi:hypothetical protein